MTGSISRSAVLRIRLTPAERGATERQARRLGLSLSEYTRRALAAFAAAAPDYDRPITRTHGGGHS